MSRVLVTGGAGYIGSHCCVALAAAGYEVVVVDNLRVGREAAIHRINLWLGCKVIFYQVDVRDRAALKAVFSKHKFDGVLHFAGLKSVGESTLLPIEYYDNNVNGSLVLLDLMQEFGVRELVFSSSATVYGMATTIPIEETAALGPTNPYGRTKLVVEGLLNDLAASGTDWRIGVLRYFNPVGAHESGFIGEDPVGVPNNLMPYIARVATGQLKQLTVFGDDFDTPDGTGIRDYVHVMDLVEAHVATLQFLVNHKGIHTWNIGTGFGCSVLSLLRAFEEASKARIPYVVGPRRLGDVAINFADASRAHRELNWTAKRDIRLMCLDAWRWASSPHASVAGEKP